MNDPIYICKPMFDLSLDITLSKVLIAIGLILFACFGDVILTWLTYPIYKAIWRIIEFKQKLSKR